MSAPLRVLLSLVLAAAALALPTAAVASSLDGFVLAQGEEAEDTTSFNGRIRNAAGDAAPGIRVVVEQDGELVAEALTGDDGEWAVEVPGAGTYDVVLDLTTLPADNTLRDVEEFERRSFELEEGDSQGVLFPLESGTAVGQDRGLFVRFLQFGVEGLKIGSIIAITSVGLSLIFGVTGLVNFAHGELVAIGALVAYAFHVAGDGTRAMPLIAAALIATVIGAGSGVALERGIFQPLRKRRTSLVAMLVITIGLSFLLRYGLQVVAGTAPVKYIDYAVQSRVQIGPISITPRDLGIILTSMVVLGLVGLLLEKTRLGTAMRAVADNRDLAESSGIDVKKVIVAVWALGGALAALGGVFQGLATGLVQFDMGFALLLLMFAGVIVGGIGTAYGAMVGGLLVGLASEISALFFPIEFKLVFAFLLLIVVLLRKPTGLLGTTERFG